MSLPKQTDGAARHPYQTKTKTKLCQLYLLSTSAAPATQPNSPKPSPKARHPSRASKPMPSPSTARTSSKAVTKMKRCWRNSTQAMRSFSAVRLTWADPRRNSKPLPMPRARNGSRSRGGIKLRRASPFPAVLAATNSARWNISRRWQCSMAWFGSAWVRCRCNPMA